MSLTSSLDALDDFVVYESIAKRGKLVNSHTTAAGHQSQPSEKAGLFQIVGALKP